MTVPAPHTGYAHQARIRVVYTRVYAFLLAAATLVLSALAQGADVTRVDVVRNGPFIATEYEVCLGVSAAAVRGLFRDIDQLIRLAPDVEAYDVNRLSATQMSDVRVVSRTCVGPFCLRVHQRQRLDASRPGYLVGTFVPGADNDFSAGYSVLEIVDEQEGQTRLRFHALIQPRFWIPPLLGKALMKRSLADYAGKFAAAMERHIRLQASAAGAAPAREG